MPKHAKLFLSIQPNKKTEETEEKKLKNKTSKKYSEELKMTHVHNRCQDMMDSGRGMA